MSQAHAITWFMRDEKGKWQWQGFKPELDHDDKIVKWFDSMVEKYDRENAPEIFIVDLEHLEGLGGDGDAEAGLELTLLQGWLDEVVQIDKITVEEDFNEYRKRKLAEAEEDDPGVDTSEEHVREGK